MAPPCAPPCETAAGALGRSRRSPARQPGFAAESATADWAGRSATSDRTRTGVVLAAEIRHFAAEHGLAIVNIIRWVPAHKNTVEIRPCPNDLPAFLLASNVTKCDTTHRRRHRVQRRVPRPDLHDADARSVPEIHTEQESARGGADIYGVAGALRRRDHMTVAFLP